MKNWLIKFLGGYTSSEYTEVLKSKHGTAEKLLESLTNNRKLVQESVEHLERSVASYNNYIELLEAIHAYGDDKLYKDITDNYLRIKKEKEKQGKGV